MLPQSLLPYIDTSGNAREQPASLALTRLRNAGDQGSVPSANIIAYFCTNLNISNTTAHKVNRCTVLIITSSFSLLLFFFLELQFFSITFIPLYIINIINFIFLGFGFWGWSFLYNKAKIPRDLASFLVSFYLKWITIMFL